MAWRPSQHAHVPLKFFVAAPGSLADLLDLGERIVQVRLGNTIDQATMDRRQSPRGTTRHGLGV